MKIKDLTNHQLIATFEDAVKDLHYQPTDYKCNETSFTYEELYNEIIKRLNKIENGTLQEISAEF